MKAITVPAIIEGIRARKDRSLGLSVSTPELSATEKAYFFELQGVNLNLLISPTDEPKAEEYKVETDLNEKRPSTRMRAVLYVLWNQNKKDQDFPEYYKTQMEKLIEFLKGKIQE